MYRIFVYNKYILCLYMFRAHVLIIRRSKLHYTASGVMTPVGGRRAHETATYRVWWYQRLYNTILTSWWWAHVLETCRGMKYTYCKTKILCIKLIKYWDKYTKVSQSAKHDEGFAISLFHTSTCFEHMCPSSGDQNCITQPLVSSHLQAWWYQRLCNAVLISWWWAHVLETCRGMK